ncbi:hypothetical protein DU508_00680 [Pedobacter chinensis]|uniref:DUF4397 domain-containing protein n=1 Tax=Pedobacter chinensis TaxID=2282421 RepID=A0A369Q235_9SPHI|nr:hypothetical protein [Pedobacter chinensis]RDC58552.1 hypothetical protein DU508_00680 [Pedobacter chinensis]
MKTKNIQKLFLIALSALLFASCKKESENIFTMFTDVTVTYNNSDPRCVTDYKVVNDKDEVWIDFTINSASEDMYSYTVEKSSGTQTPERTIFTINDPTKRRSFSNILKLIMNRDGKTTYRIYALNQKGIFIGDGKKSVTIDVNPSYMIYANRNIYLPDSVGKSLPSFFSLNDASGFSYTSAASNSAKIDFGIYRKLATNSTPTAISYTYNLYSPSVATNPLTVYDISAWTPKRTTKFSAPITGQNTAFLTGAVSGSTIETLAKARTINLDATAGTTLANGLNDGSAVFFLTPEGKYGMMYINIVTSDYQKKPYINVSVKIQR